MKKKVDKKKAPDGTGMIRQRPDGTWEGRITIGYDESGKRIRKSVYGKTQKEVVEKLALIKAQLLSDTYVAPTKMTVECWMQTWLDTYCSALKDTTLVSYKKNIKNHIIPCLGPKTLSKLSPTDIQRFYNSLQNGTSKTTNRPLSTKTVKNIHGLFHKALSQAVFDGYLSKNPADNRTFMKTPKAEVTVLEPNEIPVFLDAASGDRYYDLFLLVMFTGLRQSEVIGLTWDCIDFNNGTINIYRQYQKIDGVYVWSTLKSSKPRTITPAKAVMELLQHIKDKQDNEKALTGPAWSNEEAFVFTGDFGKHFSHNTVRKHFKRIVAKIGKPDFRFHGLRHTYASTSLFVGDDIKVVQGNLGHYSASFTLDTYTHITQQIQQASSDRMQNYIENTLL